MKRLLITLFMLGLLITACGSPDEVEPSSADLDPVESSAAEADSIETKVAATVAAALGQGAPAEPTEPAISGNATPLTPIPQLREDTTIEVSPEVEYAEPGEDGVVVFDFGGGATATAGPSATSAPTAAPMHSTSAAVGGTVFPGEGYFVEVEAALTLLDAQFVQSTTDQYDREVQAPQGFRFLSTTWTITNVAQRPVDVNSLENYARAFLDFAYVRDRDDDYFSCNSPVYANDYLYDQSMFLPGYIIPVKVVCQIPVTAAAEELDGLQFEPGDSAYRYEFDLGGIGVPADLSHLENIIESFSGPVSQKDICGAESETTYTIDMVTWYDAPKATPEEYQLQSIADKQAENQRMGQNMNLIPNTTIPGSPEEAQQQLLEYWASDLWSGYDFQALDLVAIRMTRSNAGKSNVPGGFLSDYESISLISDDTFTPTEPMGDTSRASRLVDPLRFVNSALAPGAMAHSTLYVLAAEVDDSVKLLYSARCSGTNKWVILEFPRTASN